MIQKFSMNKVSKIINRLVRVLSNVSGPSDGPRRVLASAQSSITLCGTPI